VTTAWALKKVWPEIELQIVPDAGHSSREKGIAQLLVGVRSCFVAFAAIYTNWQAQSTGYGQVCGPVATGQSVAPEGYLLAVF
jgi:hypothetical protein